MFDVARRAGERAWSQGVPLASSRMVAGKRARAYAKRHEYPTAREWARAVYDYGGVWLDGYRSAGNDQADSTGDAALAGLLRDMELSGERP